MASSADVVDATLQEPLDSIDWHKVVSFCPLCFADDHGGSWGAGVLPGGHCINCGAGGAIAMPRWAVREIRRSASWVGRRYYPQDEDRENEAERKALLSLVPEFYGRYAAPARKFEGGEWVPDLGRWDVRQQLPGGGEISSTFTADSAEAAIEASRYHMRYVPPPKGRAAS